MKEAIVHRGKTKSTVSPNRKDTMRNRVAMETLKCPKYFHYLVTLRVHIIVVECFFAKG